MLIIHSYEFDAVTNDDKICSLNSFFFVFLLVLLECLSFVLFPEAVLKPFNYVQSLFL